MPVATSTNTVVVSSVLTTVTVQLDFDSMPRWLPPLSIPFWTTWRNPLGIDIKTLFTGGPSYTIEVYIIKTGSYVTTDTSTIYNPASSAFISGTSLLLGQVQYIIQANGSFSGGAAASPYFYEIDSAGIASLQPMCLFPIIGLRSNFAAFTHALPVSLPSWAHYQPFNWFTGASYSLTVSVGPFANPTFIIQTSVGSQAGAAYLTGSSIYSGWTPVYQNHYGLIFGLSDPFLIYFKRFNVPDASYVGSPQVVPTVSWWDIDNNLISTTPLATLTLSLNSRNVGVDRDFGLAADVDLSALTPPVNARSYSADVSAVNYTSTFIMSYLTYAKFRRIPACFAGFPQNNIDGGGYVPGIMMDP